MKIELETLRPFVEPLAEGDDERLVCMAQRKAIRQATDLAIHEALLKSDLPTLAGSMAEVMITTAATLLMLNLEPGVEDFVYAAKELVEDARKVLDQGLHQREWQDVRIASVMLEIVSRGICATLSIPYEEVFAEVHRAHSEPGGVPDLMPILVKAGVVKEPT